MGNPEGQFDTKLHEAVRYSDTEEVRVALQQGYDPNLIGLYQWSALHEAAHNGEKEILQLLLQKKGDPNKCDYLQSRTAMHYAAEQGHVECLQMLVNAGGRYDIKDSSGKNCLDLATPGGRKILEKLAVRDIMLNKKDDNDNTISDEGIVTDQTSLVSSRRSSVESLKDKGPALGHILLSVEYHSNKGTMKIRIWQISDLLLPPPSTSMIHSIYVKSFLQPDKKKESKRKTEEVKVDSSEGHIHWKRKKEIGVQHVFTPATFKFSRPLEYNNITADQIKEKNLEIEVCITQRYSHRSFLIGMVRMSLKSAVKKLVKEKLPLIPCMNHTIPSSMKVYCASELNVMNNTPGGNFFFSNPNVRIVLPEDSDDFSDKAASNPDLQHNINSPSIEVDLDSQYKYVPEIPKLDLGNLTLNESGYSSEYHVSLPSDLESPDSGSTKNNTSSTIKVARTNLAFAEPKAEKSEIVLEGIQEHKLHYNKTRNEDSVVEITDFDDTLETIDVSEPVNSGISDKDESVKRTNSNSILKEVTVDSNSELENRTQDLKKKSKDKDKKKSKKGEKLTWDYSDIPLEVVTKEIEGTDRPWNEGEAPVLLPMETTMGISVPQETKLAQTEEREKIQRRSKHKYSQPVPGTAISVPQIVITKPKKEKKSTGIKETVVHISDHSLETNETVEQIVIENRNEGQTSERATSTHLPKQTKAKLELKLLDRKAFINVGKTIGKTNKEIEAESHQNKPTKESKSFIQGLKSFGVSKSIKLGKVSNTTIKFDKDSSKISDRSLESDTELTAVKVEKKVRKETRVLKAEDKSKDSDSTASSVVLDMDRISLQSSGSHVVEVIDDDISITELDENDQLFTDRSEAPSISSSLTDIESGLGDYQLPECKSPTQYMIPMQVYDVDDTSCDESMSVDESYNDIHVPTTEL